MVRKLLSLLLFLTVGIASAAEVFKISHLAIRTPGLQNVELYHCNGQFGIMKDGKPSRVSPSDVDPELRDLSVDELRTFAGMGKFMITQFDNGEYSVKTAGGLNGGGAGGAAIGVVVGHALVWGTCHSIAAIAGFFGTPAAGVAVETAISAGSPFIEAVAMKAGVGFGILFGVASGPV